MRTPAALIALVLAGLVTSATSTAVLDRAVPNNNRVAVGALRDGVLTARLEVRMAEWKPDADNAQGLQVLAFAEEGGAATIPGPLLRVTEGTELRVSVRNTQTDAPLVVHGLYTRQLAAGANDTIHIAAGTTREVRFQAGAAGTYYYWATSTDAAPAPIAPFGRVGRESQLSGALIVDPRGTAAVRDRVFVIGVWTEEAALLQGAERQVIRFVINGKSWPHTERLNYNQGDTVRWRVINVNDAVHPMHLHGFYFQVHSRGTEKSDTAVAAAGSAPQLAVTERLAPGRTTTISWVPDRPGNWLYHCHDNAHIQPQLALNGAAPPLASHVGNHSTELMQGLVMGVHVRPSNAAATAAPEPSNRRRLRLLVQPDQQSGAADLGYRFVLQDPAAAQQQRSGHGPPIVLRRGQPVSITVVNQLPEATAVHWHGIELDSYYDGVADFAGLGTRIAPAIAARDSFEARFTPPRAGTFIYHTHVDELRQQRAGLAGALLVLEPETPYDPQTDLVLLISTPRPQEEQNNKVLINGSNTPAALELRAGTRYRIRLINIHTFRPSMRMELAQGSQPQRWRALAKDGADLPAERATIRPSVQQMGNGETYDFEFTPAAPGEFQFNVRTGVGVLLAAMPIHVR